MTYFCVMIVTRRVTLFPSFPKACPAPTCPVWQKGKEYNKEGCRKLRSLFRTAQSTYEGEAVRLYRSTDEIKRDIRRIKADITEASGMLNIRNLLTEALAELAGAEPERWVPELEALVADADATLSRLRTLREDLSALRAELEDARWAIAGV